jgi:DinB superfamily
MDIKDAIRSTFETADFLVEAYLSDLSPHELMMRPVPGANHPAWQFGHLIASERMLVEGGLPGSMPPLPAGFAERHNKDTAGSDKPEDFLTKDEYFQLAKETRAATLKVLEGLSSADLDKPVSGRLPPFVKKVGDAFLTVGTHWIMHSGQWVVLRRKLGRPRQF